MKISVPDKNSRHRIVPLSLTKNLRLILCGILRIIHTPYKESTNLDVVEFIQLPPVHRCDSLLRILRVDEVDEREAFCQRCTLIERVHNAVLSNISHTTEEFVDDSPELFVLGLNNLQRECSSPQDDVSSSEAPCWRSENFKSINRRS